MTRSARLRRGSTERNLVLSGRPAPVLHLRQAAHNKRRARASFPDPRVIDSLRS